MKVTGWLVLGMLVATTGCRFERHHGDDETKSGDVKFATPFGGISVKSDEKSAQAAVGLSPYPGATVTQRDSDGKSDSAANVSMNFGNFHLGVKAVSYQTADAPDKVAGLLPQGHGTVWGGDSVLRHARGRAAGPHAGRADL